MDSISESSAGIWANPLYRKLILSMLVVLGTFLLQIIARQVLVKRLTRLSGETTHTCTLRKIIDYVTSETAPVSCGLWSRALASTRQTGEQITRTGPDCLAPTCQILQF